MMPACEVDLTNILPHRIRARDGESLPPWPHVVRLDASELINTSRMSQMIPLWMNSCRRLIFPGLWLFIALVSAIDSYLTIKFQTYLCHLEANPLARMLLRLDGWDPSLLIGSKFFGSILVLGILTILHLQNRRVGLLVTAALASFQLWLLGYLVLA